MVAAETHEEVEDQDTDVDVLLAREGGLRSASAASPRSHRDKLTLIARGRVLRGSLVSPAAIATISVPMYEKEAWMTAGRRERRSISAAHAPNFQEVSTYEQPRCLRSGKIEKGQVSESGEMR